MRFGNQALAFFLLHLAAAKGELYTYTGGKQTFMAPKSGRFRITAVGAKGGDCAGCNKATCKDLDNQDSDKPYDCYACDAQYHNGGFGARAEGTFILRKGDEIEMFVGGMGQDCQSVRQQLPVDNGEQITTPDGRDYMEALTGAGGGGGTSVRVKYANGEQQVLLAVGGGGGAAKFFNGEDGEDGPNGGWDWGGKEGGGGALFPDPYDDWVQYKPHFNGAGGGGVSGNGASSYASWNSETLGLWYDNGGEVWAEGGFSLSNGSQGGYVDRDAYGYNDQDGPATARSGSAGGYGGGGQGGPGE